MNQSSIFVALINDGRPSFLLRLRLRLLVVFGEGIWGCSRCNSAIHFFWVMKLPRLHDAQMWKVFPFKYHSMALCMILMDSSWLVSLFLFWRQCRTLYSGPCQVLWRLLFLDKLYFSRWQDQDWRHLRRMLVHSLFCGVGRNTMYVYSQRQSWGLVLLHLKLPGTWKHVPSWDGCEFVAWFSFVYVFLGSVSYGS